jgi:hypothetical protein
MEFCPLILCPFNYVQGSLLSLLYDEEQNLDRVLPFDTMLIMLCGLPQDQELSQ